MYKWDSNGEYRIEDSDENFLFLGQDSQTEDMDWHCHIDDALFKVCYGSGWKLLFKDKSGEHEVELVSGEKVFLGARVIHRLERGDTGLVLKRIEIGAGPMGKTRHADRIVYGDR